MNDHGVVNTHTSNVFEMIEEVITLGTIQLMVLAGRQCTLGLLDTDPCDNCRLRTFCHHGSIERDLFGDRINYMSIFIFGHIYHPALLMLGIIISLNFTITQLRAMLAHTQWDPSSAFCYARTKQFQTFRIGFVLYLLLPTAFLLVRDQMPYSWEQDWLSTALPNILQVLMYMLAGSTFAPLKDHLINRAFR